MLENVPLVFLNYNFADRHYFHEVRRPSEFTDTKSLGQTSIFDYKRFGIVISPSVKPRYHQRLIIRERNNSPTPHGQSGHFFALVVLKMPCLVLLWCCFVVHISPWILKNFIDACQIFGNINAICKPWSMVRLNSVRFAGTISSFSL